MVEEVEKELTEFTVLGEQYRRNITNRTHENRLMHDKVKYLQQMSTELSK
jgi:hypothetical protein